MPFDYTTRLPNQFEDAEYLKILIGVLSDIYEEGNAILRYLRDDTTIDLADGVWLDEIGDIVGVARGAGQVEDVYIFTYRDVDAPDDTLKGFSDIADPHGGHYVGIDGLPDGTVFIDADYRLLIRAKVASTYSGDSIPEIWQWIYDVFATDAFVYDSAPAEIGIDLSDYLTHTERRILLAYCPRGAGIGISINAWVAPSPPVEESEEMEFITESLTLIDSNVMNQYIKSDEINGVITLDEAAGFSEGSKLFHIFNTSVTPWKVRDSALTTIGVIYPEGEAWLALVDTGTAAGTWDLTLRGNPVQIVNTRAALVTATPAAVDTRLISEFEIGLNRNISAAWDWAIHTVTSKASYSGIVNCDIEQNGASAWTVVNVQTEANDADGIIPTFSVAAALDGNGNLAIVLTATVAGEDCEMSLLPRSLVTMSEEI